ncbi:MAG: tyrosine-type recombinase/integrase [Phycisphaerae bacterium]|jgi:integrase
MTISAVKKHKTRSDKFPLTLHPTGQFCKKIKSKLYYFGTDKKLALQRYLEQAAYLHSGKAIAPKTLEATLSIKMLCNLYLDHQQLQADIGEIKQRHVYDKTSLLKDFVKFIGANCSVEDITTIDLQNYRKKLIKAGKSPNTINNRIASIISMYNWALNNEILDKIPNLKAIEKIAIHKIERPIFETSDIEKLISYANPQMKAMILLGLNCGFGCTDCAELKWDNLDLKNMRVNFPRGKTGVGRNLVLWPETVEALKDIPENGELVFHTAQGNLWVRAIEGVDKYGNKKFTKEDAVSKQFSKLLKKADIKTEKGMGFYTLRRTAATLAARSGDPFAVQKLLGHADLKMASVYVQDVSEQTDRVINNTRKLIIQDGS